MNDQDAVTKKYLDDHAASKAYVDTENARQDIAINSKADEDEVLLSDGSKSLTGNLQIGEKKIVHLGDGSDSKDAVNYSQLIDHTRDHSRDYQLASSSKFYRDFGDKAALTRSNLVISGHRHLDLYNVGAIEGRDSGFRGEAWSSLAMTNTLERGIYSVVFKTFFLYNNLLNDETLLQSVHGNDHFRILTFSHDWQSNTGGNTPHSKAFIQFSSDGQSGEIKFQIPYYGSSYNQVGLDILPFSRVLKGKHNNTFDHQLFDVKESEYDTEFLFFEDLHLNNDNGLMLSGDNRKGNIDMSGNRIYSLQLPTGPQQPATKEYTEKYFSTKNR